MQIVTLHSMVMDTISGLYFNDSTRNNVGFFGACEGSVKVSKLGIINSDF